MRYRNVKPLLVVALLLIALVFRLWGRDAGGVRSTRLLMGTVVEIAASGDDRDTLEKAVDAAFDEMLRMEKLFSPTIPESDIARVNRLPEGADVAPEVVDVVTIGLDVARKSGGAFDMTLGGVKELWGIDGPAPSVPERVAIEEALEGTGPDALTLAGKRLRRNVPSVQIDPGGIAKGYAIDRALNVLKEYGVTSASVNAGGDIALLGEREGRPWRIGVQDPRDPRKVIATLELEGKSVVTSGDYERYFEEDGLRYHHLFDPGTGYPAKACRSVTVVAPSATLADALATALFVLGPEKGLLLLEDYPGSEALIIAADGSAATSPALQGRLTWH